MTALRRNATSPSTLNRHRIVTGVRLTTGIGEDNDDNDDETAFCKSVLSFRNKHKYTFEFNLTCDFWNPKIQPRFSGLQKIQAKQYFFRSRNLYPFQTKGNNKDTLTNSKQQRVANSFFRGCSHFCV